MTEEEKKRLKNLKKKLRRQQKLQGDVKGDSVTHPTVEPELASDSQNISKTTQQIDDKGPPKATKKRKKDARHSLQDADEKIDQASAADTVEPPKKKKKKKLTANYSFEDKNVSLSASGNKTVKGEELKPNMNKNVGERNSLPETENKLHESKGSETDNLKKKKKKKKGNRQSASEITQKTKKKNAPPLENSIIQGISDSRLAAYGENPKKIKNKVKYGKQNF